MNTNKFKILNIKSYKYHFLNNDNESALKFD